ncbi:hypothetical protein [Streptomyces sp. NPDC054854]
MPTAARTAVGRARARRHAAVDKRPPERFAGHPLRPTSTANELYDLLALQRARVRAINLSAQDLRPLAEATQQLTLDPGEDLALAIEAVTDRARARYGPGTIRPATLATSTKPTKTNTPLHNRSGSH